MDSQNYAFQRLSQRVQDLEEENRLHLMMLQWLIIGVGNITSTQENEKLKTMDEYVVMLHTGLTEWLWDRWGQDGPFLLRLTGWTEENSIERVLYALELKAATPRISYFLTLKIRERIEFYFPEGMDGVTVRLRLHREGSEESALDVTQTLKAG